MTATTRSRFARLLVAHRDARRWSQERTALESDMDHSLVSRLEGDARNPTREAIVKLATGLGLTDGEADELRIAAGFLPGRPEAILAHTPELLKLYQLVYDADPIRQIIIRNLLEATYQALTVATAQGTTYHQGGMER